MSASSTLVANKRQLAEATNAQGAIMVMIAQ